MPSGTLLLSFLKYNKLKKTSESNSYIYIQFSQLNPPLTHYCILNHGFTDMHDISNVLFLAKVETAMPTETQVPLSLLPGDPIRNY
jgi:hypothetical protein